MATCAAIKSDGTRCRAQAMKDDDRCYTHSPAMAAARRRAVQRGGRTGGRGRPKVRVDEVIKLADKQIEGLQNRSADPRRSAVMVQWANCKLKAVETERKLVEIAELEQKVADLEKVYHQDGRPVDAGPFGVGGQWIP